MIGCQYNKHEVAFNKIDQANRKGEAECLNLAFVPLMFGYKLVLPLFNLFLRM